MSNAAGPVTAIQYSNGDGTFGGNANFAWDFVNAIFSMGVGGYELTIDLNHTANKTVTVNSGASFLNGIDIITESGGITLNAESGVNYSPFLRPSIIYSVAGTPLPTANSEIKGATAIVSDATAPKYLKAYVGGGSVVCPVMCNGTEWVTY